MENRGVLKHSKGDPASADIDHKKIDSEAQKRRDAVEDAKLVKLVNKLFIQATNSSAQNASAQMDFKEADAEIARAKAKEKNYKLRIQGMESKQEDENQKNEASVTKLLNKGIEKMDHMWVAFETKSPTLKSYREKRIKFQQQQAIKDGAIESAKKSDEEAGAFNALKEMTHMAQNIKQAAANAEDSALRAHRANVATAIRMGQSPPAYKQVIPGAKKIEKYEDDDTKELNKAKLKAEQAVQDHKAAQKAHGIVMTHEVKLKVAEKKAQDDLKKAQKTAKAKAKKSQKKIAEKSKEAEKEIEKIKEEATSNSTVADVAGGTGNSTEVKIAKVQAKVEAAGKAEAKKAEKKADEIADKMEKAIKEKSASSKMKEDSESHLQQAGDNKIEAVSSLHKLEKHKGVREDPKTIIDAVDGKMSVLDAAREPRGEDLVTQMLDEEDEEDSLLR